MQVKAPAKLNLTLDVLGLREDGYHEMKMVMQSITLADTLTIVPGTGESIRVATNLDFLPDGDKNLAAVAARAYWKARGEEQEETTAHVWMNVPTLVSHSWPTK